MRKVDSVVHDHIALSYLHYATGSPVGRRPNAGAAYELAVCHAIGFGVPFNPEECIKWLNVAAMGGSIKAQQALPTFASVFNDELKDYVVAPSAEALDRDHLTVPLPGVESLSVREKIHEYSFNVTFRGGKFYLNGKTFDGNELLLQAAETCQYDALELLISNGISGSHVSKEGITALHFISSWDISKAKLLAIKIIQAGGDINAIAGRGSSIGGTPLMWSVMQDRLDHSQIILDLGGSAMSGRNEVNALVLSAHLHSVNHLRLLLGNTRPVEVTGWLHRLLVAAASGDSRFARIIRHAKKWETAPLEVFYLLRGWNAVFHESPNIKRLTFIALLESLNYSWGPSNTDIQVAFLDAAEIAPRECTALLRECIIQDNKGLFDELMRRKVPTTATFEKLKTCLHFCAQNPNNTTTTTYYAKRLLESDGVDVDARDETGLTPFMDALLARKWDLSHLLLSKGADVLATNKQGYNILALIIQNLNLGSAKWALKYSGVGDLFRQQAFLVHPEKKISAIQEAARLTLPRAHGMKTEVSGLFLFILFNFMSRERIDYRSDGLLPNASALDIAAHYGNVHAVKALVKKDAHLASGSRVTALRLARGALEKGADADDFLLNKNLERCIYILENWEKDPKKTEEMADSWTKLKTLDESNVKSSWEVVAWEWKAEPS